MSIMIVSTLLLAILILACGSHRKFRCSLCTAELEIKAWNNRHYCKKLTSRVRPNGYNSHLGFPTVKSWIYKDGSEGVIQPREMPLSAYSGLGNSKTATGFSITDIRSLGDFPDYAKLSRTAYLQYKFNKSTSRPHKRFRWPHHQTMSTYHFIITICIESVQLADNDQTGLHKIEPDYWAEFDRN
jgi:hypothetical protein